MAEKNVITDIETVESHSAAAEKRELFERQLQLQNLWGHSAEGLEAKKAAMTMLSTKNGMYAKVPIVCKGDDCPYNENCRLLPYGLAIVGELCQVETAEIEIRFNEYCKDFDFDNASFTDKNLMSEIITCDIMMERCKALMAKEGVMVVDVVAGISENGEEFYRPEVSRFWEAYERVSKKRDVDFQLMMATRRDKKNKDGNKEKNISEILAEVSSEDNQK